MFEVACLPTGTMPPTEKTETLVGRRYRGSFSNEQYLVL